MKTIYELQQIAGRLRSMTEADSISPEDTFGLVADMLAYLADMEQNSESLGVHKVYKNYPQMAADSGAPVGTNGKPLRFGQLVVIYDPDTPSQIVNGNIYAWQKGSKTSPWLLTGNMCSIPLASTGNAGLMSAEDKRYIRQYAQWVDNNANFIKALFNDQGACDMEFVAPDGSYDFSIPIASHITAGAVTGSERTALKDLMSFNKKTAPFPFRNDDGSLDFNAELVLSVNGNNLWCVAFRSDELENQRYLARYKESVISEKRYYYIDDKSHNEVYIWFISLPADAEAGSCDLSIE